MNRDSSRRAGRMLQRPPPLMRILRPPSRVRSRRVVGAPAEAAKIAAMTPAAPPPITTTPAPVAVTRSDDTSGVVQATPRRYSAAPYRKETSHARFHPL